MDDDALQLIARLSGGALRDALGLLEQAVSYGGGSVRAADVEALAGIPQRGALESLLEAVRKGDIPSVLEQLQGLFGEGYDPRRILCQMVDCVRESLLSKGCPDADTEWYARALRLLAEADADMRGHIRPDLALEFALVRLAAPGHPGESASGRAPAPQARDAASRRAGPAAGEASPQGAPAEEPPHPEVVKAAGGEGTYPDLSGFRSFLQSRFRKQPLLGKVLADAEFSCAGRKVVIKAPPPFDAILLREENLSSLREAVREFAGDLELEVAEVAPPERKPAAQPSPPAPAGGGCGGAGEREPRTAAEEQLDPVVGAALSLFKGKIIERREDD